SKNKLRGRQEVLFSFDDKLPSRDNTTRANLGDLARINPIRRHHCLGFPSIGRGSAEITGLGKGAWWDRSISSSWSVLHNHRCGSLEVSMHEDVAFFEVSSIEHFALHGVATSVSS